jgi:hypothetical protein
LRKKVTIHKKNEIIRGSDDLSVNASKTLNVIYYLLQKNNLYSAKKIKIRFSTLRELHSLSNNNDYVGRLKESLLELMKTIELNNWTNPADGKTYHWYATRFLNEANFIKENDEWFCIIEVNNTIKQLMQIKSNFTEIDLIAYSNKLRTKYSMKLYEFFKSFETYRYIDLPQQYLLKLLGVTENKTYKSYYEFNRLLERQVKEIKKKTDLDKLKLVEATKEMKKEKIFKFIINPKSKKVLQKENKKQIEETINSLIKRF